MAERAKVKSKIWRVSGGGSVVVEEAEAGAGAGAGTSAGVDGLGEQEDEEGKEKVASCVEDDSRGLSRL